MQRHLLCPQSLLHRRLPPPHQHHRSHNPVYSRERIRRPACLPRCTRHPEPWRTLATNVYRKPTHTDRYLDFQSNHPIAHKIAVIRTLNHQAKNLPSTPTATAEEERRIVQALKKNGYPRKLIQQQTHHSPPPCQDTTPPNAYVTISYVKNTSESIRRILAP